MDLSFLKNSKTIVKAYSRQDFYKKKVWNKARHYSMARVHIKKMPRVKNIKGLIRLWVPKSEIVFVDILKGKDSAFFLMIGQWMTTSFNKRKAYAPNPNSERGMKVEVWR